MEDWLHDGTVLCRLANAIKPGTIARVNKPTMPFKMMVRRRERPSPSSARSRDRVWISTVFRARGPATAR